MTQALYAHMNNKIKKENQKTTCIPLGGGRDGKKG
jgi:hypothetical protein